ncbi:MAG: dUTP diphosphatase [Kiritimatiellae bacterium]|nr:dUTP diphosphatase [Kiritimatiellia bacterium]
MEQIVRFKKLVPEAVLPSYAHPGDAGLDLTSVEDVELPPGEIRLVKTGLAMALPSGTEAQVRPRSGLAAKHGVTVANTPGTIDEGYRGEIRVILVNLGKAPFRVEKGMRIAQMVIAPVLRVGVAEVTELSDTERGTGGFGSSGV